MNILGINYLKRDPSAALVTNGSIRAVVEEERFTRKKHSLGDFPAHSIRYCLEEAGIPIAALDAITIGWDTRAYTGRMQEFFSKNWYEYGHLKDEHNRAWEHRMIRKYQPDTYTSTIVDNLLAMGYRRDSLPPVHYYPHHYCHAITAFFCSGFEDAGIITMDGHGEENCTVLWEFESEGLRKIQEFNMPDSLGWYYASFTKFLGWQTYDGEGKVMGLAPYGRKNNAFRAVVEEMLTLTEDGYRCDPSFTAYGPHDLHNEFTTKFTERFGRPRLDGTPITDEQKDIAYEAQRKLEEVGLHLADLLRSKISSRNLCIAGGVGLNCKMNGYIWRNAGFERLFIQPVSGDDGTALGAAMVHHLRHSGNSHNFKLDHVYLGPSYSNDEIEICLSKCDFSWKKYPREELLQCAVRGLTSGKVLGWFQGRMEVGPRALGCRSILVDPRRREMMDVVNKKVKFRESWRPFCPSIADYAADRYLEKPTVSPFMILTFLIRKEMIPEIPAVVHVDGTARPQLVSCKTNPLFFDLIDLFGKKSGHPVLLNTSFNIKGDPIVCTPDDAIECFSKTEIDMLVIGDFIAEKKL